MEHLLCFLCQMFSERIPLRQVKIMRNTLSEKTKKTKKPLSLNNFLREHAYRLSQISSCGSNITIHPLRNIMDVRVLGGCCSTAPPGALA